MASASLSQPIPHERALVWWVVASVAMHVLLMQLPGWRPADYLPPKPLQVELREPAPPPEITPPKPLPIQARPTPAPPKPEPKKDIAPRAEKPAPTPPPLETRAPILTAPPEVPPAPQAPVVAEQKPVPPPPPPEPVRTAPPPPPPAPAPLTAPVFDAAYLHNPKPAYPMVAMRRGESGTVYVLVQVTREGRPARVSLQKSSGSASLDEAAVRAVQGWRFAPARKGNEPIDGEVVVPMVFNINDAR